MSHFIIKTSQAKMPSSCKGNYKRIAILEVENGLQANDIKMISERAKGVLAVIKVWEDLHVGVTSKSEYYRTLDLARTELDELNCAKVREALKELE